MIIYAVANTMRGNVLDRLFGKLCQSFCLIKGKFGSRQNSKKASAKLYSSLIIFQHY